MSPDERREWLAARRLGIGSSDAPCLVGVGYKTAADVYRQKVDPPAEDRPSGFLLRGIELEPLVAEKYALRMDAPLDRCPLVSHPERPWQMASPDRVRPDGRRVELKTVVSWEEYGDDGSAEVPLGYQVQVQHQMGVSGTDFLDVAALHLFEWELRVFRVPFDPTLFAWLTGVQERFLREHVEPRVPPAADWEAQWRERATALAVRPGTSIDLGPEAAGLLRRRADLLALVKEHQRQADDLKFHVEQKMGDAEAAVAGPFKLKRSFVAGGHVSYDREPRWQLSVREAKPKAP